MRTLWHKSIGKIELPQTTNEDYAMSNKKKAIIAVSDGAGGGGVYAEEWSEYLCQHLSSTPILNFDDLNEWLDDIWEEFYNNHEKLAQKQGGLFLQKFYNEGSYATIVSAWIKKGFVNWMSYGDSTMFLYRPSTMELYSSVLQLSEYNNPPYLIGTTNQLKPEGFKSGCWNIQKGDMLFCTSDALSHYILMSYQIANINTYRQSIEEARSLKTKNSNFITAKAVSSEDNFAIEIKKIIEASQRKALFTNYVKELCNKGVIAQDDYSISIWMV